MTNSLLAKFFGSGALSVKNKMIDDYLGQVRLSKG